MRQNAALQGQLESVVASNGKQRLATEDRGLSAARGIILGLGLAVVIWALLAVGVIRLFFS
ncbi:MAG TPA: hypothetical protein VGM87_22070 [Roseomonas sp.]